MGDEDARIEDDRVGLCEGEGICPRCRSQGGDYVRLQDVTTWLRHVDRLFEIPGARGTLPRLNPLWDAANALEREFGRSDGDGKIGTEATWQ